MSAMVAVRSPEGAPTQDIDVGNKSPAGMLHRINAHAPTAHTHTALISHCQECLEAPINDKKERR